MSIDTVNKLLQRQKLVEDLVHNQPMHRQSVVETLVHRQHLAELENLMHKISVSEIIEILEALGTDDAKLLWKRVPKARKNELTWEMSDSLKALLVSDHESLFSQCQVNAFELREGKLRQVLVQSHQDLEGMNVIWIDLLNAGIEERAYIGKHYGIHLPDPGDELDLEVTSRFQIDENEDLHLHSNFLLDEQGNSRSVPVAFHLHQGILFSLRNEDLPVFRLQRRRARTRVGYVKDCFDILLDLYGADVEYCADSLEDIYRTLSRIGKQVLSETMTDEEAATVLSDIADEENLNGQVRSNIMDTQRALMFLMQAKILQPPQVSDTQQVLQNIESLNNHTAFLFEKINFLMDATIGFININQNKRVNQLTTVSVVFMPINILAGMGGMSEFSMMTAGIPWPLAYGTFAVCMTALGWATFVGLKYLETKRLRRMKRRPTAH
jgi:magnesium transporter